MIRPRRGQQARGQAEGQAVSGSKLAADERPRSNPRGLMRAEVARSVAGKEAVPTAAAAAAAACPDRLRMHVMIDHPIVTEIEIDHLHSTKLQRTVQRVIPDLR
mmetsp:Transcript_48462/g.89300  ORF Transcript_48462/g.89300 Transcript_48462/m.89300 type:complete len:104 (-) Transcript_48462:2045-2356(-)